MITTIESAIQHARNSIKRINIGGRLVPHGVCVMETPAGELKVSLTPYTHGYKDGVQTNLYLDGKKITKNDLSELLKK